MEADVSISRDQPVPVLDLPISFPTVSLTDLNEYDSEETMIFDSLPLTGIEETNAETKSEFIGLTDGRLNCMSSTKWFEIDLDKGQRGNKSEETRKSSSNETFGNESKETISSETHLDNLEADGDDKFKLKDSKVFQSKYINNLYKMTEEYSTAKTENKREVKMSSQSDKGFEINKMIDFPCQKTKRAPGLRVIDQKLEKDSVLENTNLDMDKTSVDHSIGDIVSEAHEKITDKSKVGDKMCAISNGNDINKTEITLGSRKRKQNRPIMITQGESDQVDSSDAESGSEWSHVKKKPLFSKLRVPKKLRCCRKQVQGDNSLSRCDIIEIIEDSLRSYNVPISTNRYRRHFMKKSQKVLTMQTGSLESVESQSNDVVFETKGSPAVKATDGLIQEKVKRLEEKELSNDGPLECNLCGKHFTTHDTLSAHYECHRNIEKDFENTHCLSVIKSDHANECLPDDIEVDGDSSESEDESVTSSGVDSEQSGIRPKEQPDTDILETSTYFCQVCQKRFTNISALQNHMVEHSLDEEEADSENEATGDHYCTVCQKNFASAGSLHVHNKIHSGDNPYTCPTCNKSFRDKTRLTTHIRVHTGEKPFLCSICQKSFSQKGNLKLHQKIHTGERNCICQVCGNGFRSRSDLVRHMKVHGLALSSGSENDEAAPKTPVAMTISSSLRLQHEPHEAQTRFHRSNKIKDLLEANDNMTPMGALQGVKNMNDIFKLGINTSPRRRPSQDGLDGYHRNDPFNEKMLPNFPAMDPNAYLMNLNREVEFIKAMTEAKMRSEAASMKSYVCPLCGLTLPSFDAFNHHVLLQHNPLTTFGPPIPNAAFGPTKASPNKHTSPSIFSLLDPFLSVPKSDKFKCKDCNEVFHTNEDLTVHSKTHRTKTSDTKTPVMSRDNGVGSFLSSTAIMEDMKFSASEKVYSCEFCGKTFRRSHHLQTHMRTHTGDRPYTCVECNKCFARGDHLQNHRRTHTGEKPYHCDICNRSYSQSHHLLRHKRTHTGERPYQCNLCEKTFSRDHHLKKHLETHRGLTDSISGQIDSKAESSGLNRVPRMPNIPDVPFNKTTRSTNRIGQLMIDMQAGNSASKLMESMIKRHLKEEEERKFSKCESQDKTRLENEDQHLKKETLKITDILNEEIDKRMSSHISTDLILDHVMRMTRHRPGEKIATETQTFDRSTKQSGDSGITDEASKQRFFTGDGYGYNNSVYSDISVPSTSSQNQICEKNKTPYLHTSKETNSFQPMKGVLKQSLDQKMDNGVEVQWRTLKSKGYPSNLEPQTLDDIVQKSLLDEYNIKH